MVFIYPPPARLITLALVLLAALADAFETLWLGAAGGSRAGSVHQLYTSVQVLTTQPLDRRMQKSLARFVPVRKNRMQAK